MSNKNLTNKFPSPRLLEIGNMNTTFNLGSDSDTNSEKKRKSIPNAEDLKTHSSENATNLLSNRRMTKERASIG